MSELLVEYRAKDSHLALVQELQSMGMDLGDGDIDLLLKHGVITKDTAEHEKSKVASRRIAAAAELDREVLSKAMYMAKCNMFAAKWAGREIDREDWKCREQAEFEQPFVSFINSHFRRFCDLQEYEPFYLYIKQAEDWMNEPVPDLAQLDPYERKRWCKREWKRICQNTLYALDRYVWVKEDGGMKYSANLAHAFILYLFDDGRSVFAGKGRQMAFTTTLAAAAVIRMNFRENVHVKLIACDLETTEEIYWDKVVYAFDELPYWTKCKVRNRSGKLLRVSTDTSGSKTDQDGRSSKVSIVAPKIGAINGGAPQVVLIDEAAFLDIFSEMVTEARPTIWKVVDGLLRQRRQVWAWSTGGRSETGKGSYEREHRDLFTKWTNGVFTGVVPVFLDWTCRPGVSAEWYLAEKQRYMVMSVEGMTDATIEEKLITFRQHNPSSIDDMYSIGRTTIVSPAIIIRNEDKIGALRTDLRPQPGRFRIILDKGKPLPADSFLTHEPLDVEWIPGNDVYRDPVLRFMGHQRGWVDRMYQGTDPVVHDEGYSKQASVIYDSLFRAPICQVNHRSRDPMEAYVQCIAMGMYYRNHGQRFCPELVESNIGKLYIKYKSGPEWRGLSSLVTQFQLPDYLQGGGDQIGIDTKGMRKDHIVRIGTEYTNQHGDNIFFPDYWRQLRTFNPTTSKAGKTSWSVDDRRKNQDDILDANWFAYICRLCFHLRLPMEVKKYEERISEEAGEYRLVLNAAGDPVRVHINSREGKRWLKEQEEA